MAVAVAGAFVRRLPAFGSRMPLMPHRALWICLAALSVGLVGCKEKLGGKCSVEEKEICQDKTTALVCHGGKWEEMKCKGAPGCVKGNPDTCDQSSADENDVCNLKDDVVCSGDKKTMLKCDNYKWVLAQKCGGANACVVQTKVVKCDNSVADLGDKCTTENDYACTTDKKGSLVCKNKKFENAGLCRGPRGCRINGDKIECDESIAAEGELCEHENAPACAMDMKAILVCKDKKWKVDQACKRTPCKVTGNTIDCK
jgi:hypothetical protein